MQYAQHQQIEQEQRRIVEEYHGGRLSIRESEPGKGSTFVISFPV